jgi:hypothetical protein
MNAGTYKVVFEGEILPGSNGEDVKRQLATAFGIDAPTLDRLFAGRPVVIKRGIDRETAMKYKNAFAKAGAVCRIEPVGEPAGSTPPADVEPPTTPPRTQPEPSAQRFDVRRPLQARPRAEKRSSRSHRPGKARRRYSVFHAFVMSFFSQDLYRDVGKNWRGCAFLYLLLLLALCSIPKMMMLYSGFSSFLTDVAPQLLSQIPAITVMEGQVSIDREEPYFIRNPESGEAIAVIDTTGQLNSLGEAGAYVLVTKTQVMVRKSTRETRTFDLSGIRHFRLGPDLIYRWLAIAAKWLIIALFPILVLGSFAYRIVQALIYGLIGILFGKITKAFLDYRALIRLSIVAVTPAIILDTLRNVARVPVPRWWLACFLITMVLLFFGVWANARESAPSSTDASSMEKT